MKNKVLYASLIALLVGVTAFAGWKLWQEWSEYKTGEDAYTGIGQFADIPDESPKIEEPADETQSVYRFLRVQRSASSRQRRIPQSQKLLLRLTVVSTLK